MIVLASLIPLDVEPYAPSPTPSALYPYRGPGRGAYYLGGFIGLGILLLAMALLRSRPKGGERRAPDR